MINPIVLRVTNSSGSIYDFQPQLNIDLKVDISAIENTEIGDLFGIATQEFTIIDSPNSRISEFFGNLEYAGAVANNDITQYFPCQVLNAGALVFEGQLYFKSVITDNQGYVQYNVGLVNDTITLSKQLEALTLSNLNWSKYDHAFNYNNITGSWDNSISNGDVKYPHVNYGMNQADPTCPQYAFSAWNIATTNTFDSYRKPLRIWDFKPAIKAKAVVDTIFSGSSFTYTSSFFNSTYFNNLYILPSANNNLGANPSNAVSQSIWVYASASQNTGILPSTAQKLDYDTFYIQNGSGFSTGTDTFTANTTGNYNISANVVFFVRNYSPYISGIQPQVDLYVLKNGVASPVLSSRQYLPGPTSSLSVAGTLNLNAGDYLDFYLEYNDAPLSTKYLDTANAVNYNPIGAPTTDNGVYTTKVEITTNALADNFNVNMGAQFPADLTSLDVMKGLIEKFNLVVEPLPGTKTFRIEPYQNWIDQGAQVDWSDKVDIGTKFEISHPATEQPKTIIFSDEEDSDFYNVDAKSKNRFGLTYGAYVFNFDGDIAQNSERKVGTTFAATPVSAIPNSTEFIVPHLCEIADNTTTTPIQYKPRLLYDNGKKTTPNDALGIDASNRINRGKYWIRDNATGLPVSQSYWYQMTPLTTVPANFASGQDLHFDNLNWQPYIQLYSNGRTANSAYSTYWGSYINTLYDEDARKLKCNVYLTPLDIANLSLNNKYFIMGNYWRINKISSANLCRPQNTEVELIKIPARTTKFPSRRTYIRGLQPAPSNPAIRISAINANGTVSYEDASTGASVSSYSLVSVAGPKDNLIVSQTGSNAVAVWNYQQQTTPQSTNQQQTILGVNNVNAIASRVSVVGSENEIAGTTDSIDLTGDGNIIGETNTNITIISSNDNTVTAQAQNNVIIIGGENNTIQSSQLGAYDTTSDVSLINVSGSTIDNTFKTNFIGRFTQNLNSLGTLYSNASQGYDYYGMNIMANTALEEGYWFNVNPVNLNNTGGNKTFNLGTAPPALPVSSSYRNKYLFLINKSGATGTTTINLDDIGGVSTNFPNDGRAMLFWTNGNVNKCNRVVINKAGSDIFLPDNSFSITLDEPYQCLEIHASSINGQGYWKVIRRTTETRRNSYLQAVNSNAVVSILPEEVNTCVKMEFDTTLFSCGIDSDGATFTFPANGVYEVTVEGNVYNPNHNNVNGYLTLYQNGTPIPYSSVGIHADAKGHYYYESKTWMVYITDACNEDLSVYALFDNTETTFTAYQPGSNCIHVPALAIQIKYVGGGYGVCF